VVVEFPRYLGFLAHPGACTPLEAQDFRDTLGIVQVTITTRVAAPTPDG